MGEENDQLNQEPNNPNQEPNQPNPDQEPEKDKSNQDINKIIGQVHALSRVVQQQNETIKQLQENSKKKPEEDQKERTLRERLQYFEQKEQKIKQRTVRNAIREAAEALGVPDSFRPYVAEHLSLHHKFEVDDAEEKVEWSDGVVRTPIKEFVADFLKTDEGKIFLPAPKAPQTRPMVNPGIVRSEDGPAVYNPDGFKSIFG